MIFSDSAARAIRASGAAPFDLHELAPVVAYVDQTGRVWCPAHQNLAHGNDTWAEDPDNSAMEDERCDACNTPIAAVMLAARCARFIADCSRCRRAYLDRDTTPARPCPAHATYPAEILRAIVDCTPMPSPPWRSAATA